MADDETELLEPSREALRVTASRAREARQAGLSRVEARMFAESDQDIGTLRRLVASGCPVETLRKIVL